MFEFRLEEGDPHVERIEAENITNAEAFRIEEGNPYFVGVDGEYNEYDDLWVIKWIRGQVDTKLWLNFPKNVDFIFTHWFISSCTECGLELKYDNNVLWRHGLGGSVSFPMPPCTHCVNIPISEVYFRTYGPEYVETVAHAIFKSAYLVNPSYDNYLAEGDNFYIVNTMDANKHPKIKFTLNEYADKFRVIKLNGVVVRDGTVELWGYSTVLDKNLLIGKDRLPCAFVIPPKYQSFYIILKDNVKYGKDSLIILNKIVKVDLFGTR